MIMSKTYSEDAVQAILDTAKVQADMLKERIAELENPMQRFVADYSEHRISNQDLANKYYEEFNAVLP